MEEEKPKRRVWKQEKYSANEASESRRSTEVRKVTAYTICSGFDINR